MVRPECPLADLKSALIKRLRISVATERAIDEA